VSTGVEDELAAMRREAEQQAARAGLAECPGGVARYNRGCRCDKCRAAKAASSHKERRRT